MSKEIITLNVHDTDLVNILKILYQNDYDYVIVHKPIDIMPIYKIEAHIGDLNKDKGCVFIDSRRI